MICFTWEDTQRLFIFTGNLAHDPEYLFTVNRPDYLEEKYKGPDAFMVDISGRGWVGAKPL